MNYNESLFNCTIYQNEYQSNICELKLGYTKSFYGIGTLIGISLVGIILNIIFLVLSFVKRKKKLTRKALMRQIFLIFPFTDLFTSIYWLISAIKFYELEQIKENMTICSLNSVFYIFLITFQFILINILLFHFRKINQNPLEAVFNPKMKLFIYLIICFILSFIVSGLAERLQLTGISPMNTCFISIKGDLSNLIFLIPLLCIIFAIGQLIHDLFFIYMFNSDKGIRRIYKKNSCYVFIFCLLHIPLILVMVFSYMVGKNYFELKENAVVEYFIKITTIITCIIPFTMSILRQIQGLTRLECIHGCLKKKDLEKVRKTIANYSKVAVSNVKESISIELDPFEWLENHIMENFMRDILLGVAVSIKGSRCYENEVINEIGNEIKLKDDDFQDFKTYEINFKNFKKFGISDNLVENSDYLNVQVIEYAPKCFYYLRKLEDININRMVESFLPKNNSQKIKESLGKSGSFFISTDDNRYMVKSLKSEELDLLKHAFLKEYINHIEQNPKSLLCRLYGMYNIILGQGDETLIIVMRNVIGDFKDNTIVKFDLKGSTYRRKSNFLMGNDSNVMKDLDFNEFERSIMMSPASIERLRNITEIDSTFLKNSELMDYSLFLVKLTLTKKEAEDVFGKGIYEKQDKAFIQIINDKDEDEKRISNRDNRLSLYRGAGDIHEVKHYKQYLFPSLTQGTAYIISIIDYFQIFNFFKYMESHIKNISHKKNTVSCVDPKTYSERFIKYINVLTDVKQFLSKEIKEEDKIEEKDEEYLDDEDENESLVKRMQKRRATLSLGRDSQKSNQNQLLIQNESSEN